jgi:hypothetical protein
MIATHIIVTRHSEEGVFSRVLSVLVMRDRLSGASENGGADRIGAGEWAERD